MSGAQREQETPPGGPGTRVAAWMTLACAGAAQAEPEASSQTAWTWVHGLATRVRGRPSETSARPRLAADLRRCERVAGGPG